MIRKQLFRDEALISVEITTKTKKFYVLKYGHLKKNDEFLCERTDSDGTL